MSFLIHSAAQALSPLRGAAYPAVSITGGDISPAAVQTATQNAPEQVEIRLLDACDLKEIPSGSITSIVTNLPLGRRSPKMKTLTPFTAGSWQKPRGYWLPRAGPSC